MGQDLERDLVVLLGLAVVLGPAVVGTLALEAEEVDLPRVDLHGLALDATSARLADVKRAGLTVPIPLTEDPEGVIRVAETRVTLDTVIEVYKAGSTPEEIARHYYPALELADVYAVVTYYLRHKDEVEAYLARRREEAAAVRREVEGRSDTRGLRERLLSRLEG